jgi:phosphoglycolate phosphatase
MLKAIIFDFDGVIGDTYHLNFEISKIFDKNLTEQDFIDHHKGNVYEAPRIIFQPKDIPIFFKKQKQKFTVEHLFPLEKILIKLRKKYRLFIISSTKDENIKHFLKIGNYDYFFEQILGATTHKSKIEKFKMIFAQHNLKPAECLFITDTVGDIIEGKKVKVKTIGVTWGYHEKKLLQSQKPYAIAHNPDELLKIIGNLKNILQASNN